MEKCAMKFDDYLEQSDTIQPGNSVSIQFQCS